MISSSVLSRCVVSLRFLNGLLTNSNNTNRKLSLSLINTYNHSRKMSNAAELYHYNKKCQSVGDKNVWVEFTALARDYNAVNLGQGFPDYQSVPYLEQKVEETLKQSNSLIYQYTRSPGHLRLVNAIAKCYSHLLGREIDPLNEVLVTVGAYGSLYNSLSGFLEKDDEVIIIEPFFDCYAPMAVLAEAKCRFIPLRPGKNESSGALTTSADWKWDENELESAFNSKTKCIIINSPNNPLGKVYTREELSRIAELCIKHNVICISDEVYEHITYEREQTKIATLPGMWERTITIGSAGKSFSSTGTKMGWTVGPRELVKLCQIFHNNSIYCCPTFFQEVIARCFELENSRLGSPESYFKSISTEIKPKRDYLVKLLLDAGLTPVVPEGGYFLLADISKIAKNFSTDSNECKDSKFVKFLIKEKGLATIPTTAFYSKENQYIGENFIRFCFFKNESTLEKAAEILKNLKVD